MIINQPQKCKPEYQPAAREGFANEDSGFKEDKSGIPLVQIALMSISDGLFYYIHMFMDF